MRTLAQVRAGRGAVQKRWSDLGRAMAAQALWRGGMLAADYVAIAEHVANAKQGRAGVSTSPPARPPMSTPGREG